MSVRYRHNPRSSAQQIHANPSTSDKFREHLRSGHVTVTSVPWHSDRQEGHATSCAVRHAVSRRLSCSINSQDFVKYCHKIHIWSLHKRLGFPLYVQQMSTLSLEGTQTFEDDRTIAKGGPNVCAKFWDVIIWNAQIISDLTIAFKGKVDGPSGSQC